MDEYEDPEPKGKLILKVGRLVILDCFNQTLSYHDLYKYGLAIQTRSYNF